MFFAPRQVITKFDPDSLQNSVMAENPVDPAYRSRTIAHLHVVFLEIWDFQTLFLGSKFNLYIYSSYFRHGQNILNTQTNIPTPKQEPKCDPSSSPSLLVSPARSKTHPSPYTTAGLFQSHTLSSLGYCISWPTSLPPCCASSSVQPP